jgi:hypothetical protein
MCLEEADCSYHTAFLKRLGEGKFADNLLGESNDGVKYKSYFIAS